MCSEYVGCLRVCGSCTDELIFLEECIFDQNTNGLAPCNFGDCGLSVPEDPGEDPIDNCPTELNNFGDCVTNRIGIQ